ncbi:MAG: glycerol-3-phosphate 1-O-acyltransferase PlsY [Leptothrix sp. (in: b-proteobacteria)]
MNTALLTLATTLLAYLIGSLSFAVIVSRVMGLNDPRSYGSGNPGATNVLRSGNKKAAVLTLVFDLLKGLIPVLLVVQFGAPHQLRENSAALVGLAAFLGHLWPVFFRFQGGKGVATAAGVLLGIDPLLGLATLAVWVVVATLTRYSSLAALIAAVAAPVLHIIGWGPSGASAAIVVMSALLVWRHRGNIAKLMAGTEGRIGQKSAAAAPAKAAGAPVKKTAHDSRPAPHAKGRARRKV